MGQSNQQENHKKVNNLESICKDEEHDFQILGHPYSTADSRSMVGEKRVANYVCKKCGLRETFDYQDFQEISPM